MARLADTLVLQARDPARATLLATAKLLADQMMCPFTDRARQ